jgi:hypothetical protein
VSPAGAETPLGEAGALLALLEQMLRLRRLDQLKTVLPRLDAAQRGQLQDLLGRCQQQTAANEALLNVRSRRAQALLQLRHGAPGGYDTSGHGRYEVQRNFRVTA